jgi:hypothetical protein
MPDFSQFANGPCTHIDVWVHLNPHLIRQVAKNNVERSNTFGLVSHWVSPFPGARLLQQKFSPGKRKSKG